MKVLIYKLAAEGYAQLVGYFESAFQDQLQYQSAEGSIYNTKKRHIISEMECFHKKSRVVALCHSPGALLCSVSAWLRGHRVSKPMLQI